MNNRNKSKEELIKELHEQNFLLREENNSLKAEYEKDITERKRAEEALQLQSEIVENMQEGAILIRIGDGVIVYANPAMERISGFTNEEFVGMQISEINAPTDKNPEEISRVMIDSLNTNGNWRGEVLNLKKDGTTYWCYANITEFKHTKYGNVWLSIHQDITERKQGEILLQQTRQNYETFFNTIDEFLYVLDEQGNIIHTNNTVKNRLGYTEEELIGKSVLMQHPPERREEAGRIVGEMLSGTAEFCPVPIITKSGIQIPVETRITRGVWDGKPVLYGVTKDISEIRLSEEKFSKVFHINPSACGLSDLDTGKYVEVNEAFYTLLGYAKDEVIGKTALDIGILNTETRNAVLLKADNNGNVTNTEAELKAKNGDIKKVLLSSENIFVQDKKYRFTVVNDITERKKAEEELRESEENLRKINAEKDKFFSIIAHDLRSPFNGFLGLTEIMAEGLQNLTLEEIQNIAVSMKTSANNLYRLLGNLLEWSRMQRGLTAFEPQLFLLSRKITESMALVTEAADKKAIAISYDIPEDLSVFADGNMLEGIIRNLASNAVKFTNKGGVVNISAKTMPDKTVEISVKDTGIGMDKKITDNIFRLDVNTSRKGTEGESSTGLGLIICKDFIEKHGGKLRVESGERKGSVFTFTIPENVRSDAVEHFEDVLEAEHSGEIKDLKILIAEDDEKSDRLLKLLLKTISKEYLHAKTGIEAVEACRNNPDIDVVLMDIKMPGMDGYEATRQIRKFNKDVVIIMQTAHGLIGDRKDAIEAGCNDYILKPIIKGEIIAMIKRSVKC